MTYLLALAFVAIIGSLGAALYFMMKGGKDGKAKSGSMARALAFRVGFSVLVFLCMLIAWKMGWVHPTGFRSGQ